MPENIEYKPFVSGQYNPEEPGFYNTVSTYTVSKNDCPSGGTASSVTLTANANQFKSIVSQIDAQEQAEAWLHANAQAYANNLGVCSFQSIYPATKSVIFENQDSSWNNCKSASSADYIHTTNKVIGSGLSSSTFYLNRYRGIIDTSGITTRPISAKIRFKFNTNPIGNALTMNLFASETHIPLSQTFQVSDWNDWSENSFINSVLVPNNSTTYNEIPLTSSQLDLLYSEQLYDFFIISNGDRNGFEPSTNNRPELSILQSTGEVYLECDFGNEVSYYNQAKSLNATKNDCSSGYVGSTVTLTANANQFSSTISQAEANAQADAWLSENVQMYANNNGQCQLNITPPVDLNFEIDWGWVNYNNNSGTFQYKVEVNTGSGWIAVLDRNDTIYTSTSGYSDVIQSTISSHSLIKVSGSITQSGSDSLYLIDEAHIVDNFNMSNNTSIYNVDQNFGVNGSYAFEHNINLSDYEVLENDIFVVYINVDFGN